MCECLHLCFSQQGSAAESTNIDSLIFKLNCFKNLATEKCHVAFQLQNYFTDEFSDDKFLSASPRVRVCRLLCVRL